ncbi:MAG: hypothetical protein N2319_12275 [Candidatus Kapabacteria bacterium]|nr:hypothetical protein [Candidatus Kapabacteria bacterium]
MKRFFEIIAITAFVSMFLIAVGYAQTSEKVIGTIGKEKIGSDAIVICVYGTAACMPVKIDSTMTVVYQGKKTKLTGLPFGLYLEANIALDQNKESIIKSLNIDETKTVICFTELEKKQRTILKTLLKKIQGVKDFKIISKSKQAYIKFEPRIISYNELENKIKNVGFSLE